MSKESNDKIICYCNNIKYSEINKILVKNPNIDFEKFQNLSNAGTSCSACLPRLENIFVEKSNKNQNFNYSTMTPKIAGLKSSIYSFLDKMLPNFPVKLINYFPIIFKENIQTKVWVSNFGNLYKDQKNIVEHKIKINFFNSIGNIIWNYSCIVNKNENKIIDIPTELLKKLKDDPWSNGWLRVEKKSLSSGYKGTTRPQIQIISNKSSCSVHGQNIKINNGGFYSYVNNPKSEKQLLSFFNIGKKKINIKLDYLSQENEFINFDHISLNSLNSKIIEVKLDDKGFKEFDPINIKWSGIGHYKAHIYITDKKIERMSLDHL
jgi:bacterioferritin-associated ferredoxin